MDIKAKLVKAFDSGKVKGIFDVTLDDQFAIHGVKLIKGEKGDFVSMPSSAWKNRKGEMQYDDVVHPLNSETRSALFRAVSDAYYDHTHPMIPNDGMGELPFGW
jgi:stage V sporulation protein G